jgi:FkbM family methyltransferase
MTKSRAAPVALAANGFNELRMCRGGPMVYNKFDQYVGASFAKYGEFSLGEQVLFGQLVRPGAVVVEAGANIGGHTVELARLAGPHGAVHAFEPQRIVFQTLCANLALNQCDNVFAYQSAVGAECGTALVPPMEPTVRANFGGVALAGVTAGESVPLVAIDSIDLPTCQFLKVDVEGMETEVLRGATGTIDVHRPILYVENDREDKSAELLTQVFDLGYDVYWHVPLLFNATNFDDETEDIFPLIRSANILCMPAESRREVVGLQRVASAKETWRDAMRVPSE